MKVDVYRCAVHGLIEAVDAVATWRDADAFQPSGPPTFHCRVSESYDGSCYLQCKGPFEVEVPDAAE